MLAQSVGFGFGETKPLRLICSQASALGLAVGVAAVVAAAVAVADVPVAEPGKSSCWALVMLPQLADLGLWPRGSPPVRWLPGWCRVFAGSFCGAADSLGLQPAPLASAFKEVNSPYGLQKSGDLSALKALFPLPLSRQFCRCGGLMVAFFRSGRE